jgi:hypothetical protein
VSQADSEDDGRAADSSARSATFEEIVAGWVAEGSVPRWPDATPGDPSAGDVPSAPIQRPAPTEPLAIDRGAARPADDEDHYVPPEPPPLPRIRASTSVGLALLGLGLALLVVPGLLGSGATLAFPLGLVALALGLGWLVLRSWPSKPSGDGDGPDDGAVL